MLFFVWHQLYAKTLMYTSYFAKLYKLKNPISISRYSPSWYHGVEYKKLAPDSSILVAYKNKEIDTEEYTKRFLQQLATLDPRTVYQELRAIHNSKIFCLLCYEKPYDFCHRHLVCDWLNSNLRLKTKITEYSCAPRIGLF